MKSKKQNKIDLAKFKLKSQTLDKFADGLNTKLKQVENTYIHGESIIKDKCRTAIYDNIKKMFPLAETLNTFTLGGEKLVTEIMLSKFYKLNGKSYEFNENTIEKAKNNAPKGIEIVGGDIFSHVYKGVEQFIWFDFMTTLRPDNIINLIKWLSNNPIKNDCVFAVTYTLHSRKVGEGYKQLFGTEEAHNEYIDRMGSIIGTNLVNQFVGIKGGIKVIRYCNTDINKRSLPMVQYIFNLHKK